MTKCHFYIQSLYLIKMSEPVTFNFCVLIVALTIFHFLFLKQAEMSSIWLLNMDCICSLWPVVDDENRQQCLLHIYRLFDKLNTGHIDMAFLGKLLYYCSYSKLEILRIFKSCSSVIWGYIYYSQEHPSR